MGVHSVDATASRIIIRGVMAAVVGERLESARRTTVEAIFPELAEVVSRSSGVDIAKIVPPARMEETSELTSH
jgi:hypothetical protein